MTVWHFLLAYLILTVAGWVGAIRARRPVLLVAAILVPIVGAFVWVGGLWIRMDWEIGFLDQPAWILAGHALLLAVLGGLAALTWRASP